MMKTHLKIQEISYDYKRTKDLDDFFGSLPTPYSLKNCVDADKKLELLKIENGL